EQRPLQGAQDARRDPEGAPGELRLRRQAVGHAHRGKGAGAGRGPEQPEGAALVVHPCRDPRQHEPLWQPGRVRPYERSGAAAERQPVACPLASPREAADIADKAGRTHPPDGVAGRPPRRPPPLPRPPRARPPSRAPAHAPPGPAIRQQLRSFGTLGSVLYIAAHPDDENTQVIAYLARGRGYRTAYLSLTRGDGGQNLLGPQLREQLGVARTEELLEARKVDGGRQYFTRANDFGFSKDYRETLQIWDRQAVLADIVRVIRVFRPDVIVTRFAPEPGPTHGHHTASVVLAVEAFKLAGDSQAFPEQLHDLTPWQPIRIFHNIGLGGAGVGAAVESETAPVLKLEIGGADPVTGESFAAIAGRSRAMHKTQGFGTDTPGPGGSPKTERFRLLGGTPATQDLLDGVDTTWNRVPGGAEIALLTEATLARFDPDRPAASVPALLMIHRRLAALAALPADLVVIDKRQQLDDIIRACLGLEVETVVDQPEVVPGETLKMRHTAVVRSGFPVRWTAVRYPSIRRTASRVIELRPNHP